MMILIRETPIRDGGVEERGERKGESGANIKRTFGLSFMNINDVAGGGWSRETPWVAAEDGTYWDWRCSAVFAGQETPHLLVTNVAGHGLHPTVPKERKDKQK
jgi:hypothetical protein